MVTAAARYAATKLQWVVVDMNGQGGGHCFAGVLAGVCAIYGFLIGHSSERSREVEYGVVQAVTWYGDLVVLLLRPMRRAESGGM